MVRFLLRTIPKRRFNIATPMPQESIVSTSNRQDLEPERNPEVAKENTLSPGRRRLIQGASAAPVLLVSGRSALACDPDMDKCALSPMAWMSIHPNKKTETIAVSHNVGCNFMGKSPGYWKPNSSGKTFQGPWPAGIKPFNQLKWHKIQSGRCTSTQLSASWTGNWNSYSGLPYNDCKTGADAGWNSGSKLPFASDSRSISRILIEETASQNILWHICAAYLNALTWPDYALTPQEVADLYTTRRLVAGGRILSDSEIKAFLDQTWL